MMPGIRAHHRLPRPRRAVATLAVALLLPLTGCGGDSTEDYCGAIQAANKKVAAMIASDSPSALLSNVPLLKDLAQEAPEDIADEWQTLIGALEGLDEALDDAGVQASDFTGGKPPAGLGATDQKAIADAAGQVGGEDVVQATYGIEQQARDVCKVNLGLS